MAEKFVVTTFYRFFPIKKEELEFLRARLVHLGEKLNIVGLLLLGTEGVNATVAGVPATITEFKSELLNFLNLGDLNFKDSLSDITGFNSWQVKIRDEIVTLGRSDLVPNSPSYFHLSPEEWDKLSVQPDSVILDTRNNYEFAIGHFKGAQHLNIEEFSEFPKKMEENQMPKDKTYLIYCTGGIRCEKAILALHQNGYNKVYQLDGGIINYLKQKPHAQFEGECFVFDHRVAVDQELKPTRKYSMCPHCGQPAQTQIECALCQTPAIVCELCLKADIYLKTCSKNCTNHYRLGHKSRKPQHNSLRKNVAKRF